MLIRIAYARARAGLGKYGCACTDQGVCKPNGSMRTQFAASRAPGRSCVVASPSSAVATVSGVIWLAAET